MQTMLSAIFLILVGFYVELSNSVLQQAVAEKLRLDWMPDG
jgi:hypothetical protein